MPRGAPAFAVREQEQYTVCRHKTPGASMMHGAFASTHRKEQQRIRIVRRQ